MGKFLAHAIRRKLEYLMYSSLFESLKLWNVGVKEYLGNISKTRYSTFTIPDNSG